MGRWLTITKALKNPELVLKAEMIISIWDSPDMWWENWSKEPGLVAGKGRTETLYKRCFAADEWLREQFGARHDIEDLGGKEEDPRRIKEYENFIKIIRKRLKEKNDAKIYQESSLPGLQ